tara:strand:+ start:1148 stop:1618 length:471 start_codon:yes stop_codon:yes gene_type:complete
MKVKQKPLSFSLHPDNHAYIEAVVAKQKETNHRYNRSTYMDDLITHLRLKAATNTITGVTDLTIDKPKPKSKRFVPPAFQEVDAYMIERGVNDNAEAKSFCDFYESKGWVVGKAKMKCWKAAVRNWLKNYKVKTKGTDILQLSADSNWEEGINEIF